MQEMDEAINDLSVIAWQFYLVFIYSLKVIKNKTRCHCKLKSGHTQTSVHCVRNKANCITNISTINNEEIRYGSSSWLDVDDAPQLYLFTNWFHQLFIDGIVITVNRLFSSKGRLDA